MNRLFTFRASSAALSLRQNEVRIGGSMSRAEILKSIEAELSRVRDMASRANESILLYLIDMAILEVKSKIPSGGDEREGSAPRTQFSKRYNSG
jgi:hypothetical protein